jgi:ATPase subunit of ABC transporter with duplicated ATPase domains
VVGVAGPNGTGKTTLFKLIAKALEPLSGSATVGSTVEVAYGDQERTLGSDSSLIEEIGGGAEEIIIGKRTVPIRKYLAQFGFRGASQQKKANELSGGERNRAHLAKILKAGGNVILLDEPTNDLDVNTLRMLEEAVMQFSGCMLVISHDRFFLDRVCTHMLVFEGDGKVRWFEGNFAAYEEWRKKELGDSLFENRRNRYRTLVKA